MNPVVSPVEKHETKTIEETPSSAMAKTEVLPGSQKAVGAFCVNSDLPVVLFPVTT
jgi:hypothetical protein